MASAAAGIVGKEDFAKLMWQVSKDPEIAAQRDDLTGKAINMIGETLPYITATTAATLLGGGLGGFAVGAIVEGGASYRQALDEGVPEDKARLIGVGVGMLNGAIETVGGKGAEALLSKAITKLQGKLSGSVVRFGVRTVVEALEEGAQELSTITGESTYKDVDWNDVVDRTLGSMAGGAFLGGAFNVASSGTSALDQVTNKKINNQQQEIRPEPVTETGKAGPIPADMVFGKGLGTGSDTASPRVQIQPDFAPRPKDIYRKQVRDNIEDTANEVARMDAELAEIQKPATAEKKPLSLSEMASTVKDKSNKVGTGNDAVQGNVEGSGEGKQITVYQGSENGDKPTGFVSTDEDFAKDYGKVTKLTISPKKVFDSGSEKDVQVLIDKVGSLTDSYDEKTYKTAKEFIENLGGSDTWESVEPHIDAIKSMGFDAIKIYEGGVENYYVPNLPIASKSNVAKPQNIVPEQGDMAKKSEKVDISTQPATISPVQDNEVARDNIAPQDTTEAGKGMEKNYKKISNVSQSEDLGSTLDIKTTAIASHNKNIIKDLRLASQEKKIANFSEEDFDAYIETP
jgi:hypothetical protein